MSKHPLEPVPAVLYVREQIGGPVTAIRMSDLTVARHAARHLPQPAWATAATKDGGKAMTTLKLGGGTKAVPFNAPPDASYLGFHAFPSGGSFEVWEANTMSPVVEPGFYWWPCHPGCLPDSDEPNGPFTSAKDAYDDARGGP